MRLVVWYVLVITWDGDLKGQMGTMWGKAAGNLQLRRNRAEQVRCAALCNCN